MTRVRGLRFLDRTWFARLANAKAGNAATSSSTIAAYIVYHPWKPFLLILIMLHLTFNPQHPSIFYYFKIYWMIKLKFYFYSILFTADSLEHVQNFLTPLSNDTALPESQKSQSLLPSWYKCIYVVHKSWILTSIS